MTLDSIPIDHQTISINKGVVVIEERQDSENAIYYDKKFLPYIRSVKSPQFVNIKVNEALRDTVVFYINVASLSKCNVTLDVGLIQAKAVCQDANYRLGSGAINFKVPEKKLGFLQATANVGYVLINDQIEGTPQFKGKEKLQKTELFIDKGVILVNNRQ